MGFSPEAEEVEGVVQECDTDLSPDVDSFLSVFCAGTEDVSVGSFDKEDAPLASNDFFGW
jgi:hypothetical protein